MTALEILVLVFGSIFVILAVICALASLAYMAWRVVRRKQDRALELLQYYLCDPFLVRARVISEQYLLADPRCPQYARFAGRNLEEVEQLLNASADVADQEARLLIRAHADFFHAVELARRHGLIRRREALFSRLYATYWANLMEDRLAGITHPRDAWQEFKHLRNDVDMDDARRDRAERMRQLGLVLQSR